LILVYLAPTNARMPWRWKCTRIGSTQDKIGWFMGCQGCILLFHFCLVSYCTYENTVHQTIISHRVSSHIRSVGLYPPKYTYIYILPTVLYAWIVVKTFKSGWDNLCSTALQALLYCSCSSEIHPLAYFYTHFTSILIY
jgi:hypothetical protein